MKVAVIIPVHNRAQLIKRAVESVLEQTYRPHQIIVVDDGSKDGPAAALQEFAMSGLKVIAQSHQGVAAARNRGIKESQADWLAFLDSDDWWLPTKLKKQIDWHQLNGGSLISQTDEIWIRNGRRVNPKKYHLKSEGYFFKRSLERCLITPSAVLMNRRLFREVGLFDPSMPVCEDYDLWLRITARYHVGLISEKLVVKTGGHADQLSREYWGMDRFRVKAIKKLLDEGTLDEEQRRAALAVLEKKLSVLKNGAIKRGNVELLDNLKAGEILKADGR